MNYFFSHQKKICIFFTKKIGEVPRGHKRKKSGNDSDDENGMIDRFRRGEDTPSDYEIESKSDDEDEEMNLNQR